MEIYKKSGTKERLFEMMKGVNGIKKTINENYDSPKEKDEEYLDKSVDTDGKDVSKYDGDLNYPVEKDLRVNSDLIHQEPVSESVDVPNVMESFQSTEYNYDQKGNWIPKGHEDKMIAIRSVEQPFNSGNWKELIVKITPDGHIENILDTTNSWDEARTAIKKHLGQEDQQNQPTELEAEEGL